MAILSAAQSLLLRSGSAATVDQVAHEAGCAKGLVHYHFHTKSELLAAVAAQLAGGRRTAWAQAFEAGTPEAAIQRSWDVLLAEHRAGVARAWLALCAERDPTTGRTVRNEIVAFSSALTQAARRLLSGLGLRPTVPLEEIGCYLAAVIEGMGSQLAAGVDPARLQGAYAAAWLGVLSLASGPGR